MDTAEMRNDKSEASKNAGEKSTNTEDEDASNESISEHITSISGSVENDRSLQEIEIENRPSSFFNLGTTSGNLSQELKPNLLDINSDESDSVTFGNKEAKSEIGVKSILEEILNNEQFHSDIQQSKSTDESFNVFANVNFDDKSLIGVQSGEVSLNNNLFDSDFKLPLETEPDNNENESDKKIKCLEEILAVKETTINALNSEIESLREGSNTFTSSMVSATEYKQLQEDCNVKLMEYDSAIMYKNNIIQQLTESLEQSVNERNDLLKQVESFKSEIAELHEKMKETSKMLESHRCEESQNLVRDENVYVPISCSKIEETSDTDDIIKLKTELHNLKEKVKSDKEEYESELKRLRNLLDNVKCGSTEFIDLKTELEIKHSKEVEELRIYFEKKCAELEKNYSEEVFSQQSRKLSGSSSDIELSNDILFSNQPGPGGDNNRFFKSKEDVDKFQENISTLLNKISKHVLEDVNEKILNQIEMDVRNELTSLLKIGEKLEIKAIQNKYLEEISNLKYQLDECNKHHIPGGSAIQEVGSSGEFEINDIVQSYERRLEEQITLAKNDFISALVAQFQRLLTEDLDDEEWPSELLHLRDKCANKYETEIAQLKEDHAKEIEKLKSDHLKILNGALERARRRSLRDSDSFNKTEIEILKERDNLKKQVSSLRNLLGELVKYFTQCEDALNDTLVEELLKQGIDKNLSQLDDDSRLDESSGTNSSKLFDSLANITRVHLTPNFEELINRIENHSQEDEAKDISLDLKNELGLCLQKLRQDANAILAITSNIPRCHKGDGASTDLDDKVSSLTNKLLTESQAKEEVVEQLKNANLLTASLEKEKLNLEVRLDEALNRICILERDLENTKHRIADLIEQGRNEIVSEAYGEAGNQACLVPADTTTMLENLQEKAAAIIASSSADQSILQLVEELCQVAARINENFNKDRFDLLQQIDVADKKYKTTQRFLEEQAMEREQERDEAQKIIEQLHEKLKERDKDRVNCELMSCEAENLEYQLEEASKVIKEQTQKYKELQSERDEAVDKIKYLREIIRELETQNDIKLHELEEQFGIVQKLQCLIEEQSKVIDDFKGLESFKSVSENQKLYQHVEELEKELQQLRVGAELAGSEGAAKQIKLQLLELEMSLDKKTKDLELLHSTGTNSCSSPSEDMSVRDVIRSQTPTSATLDDCEVPLQQLARLKEKLMRHSRAEEAAIKRIRDLEMQIKSYKDALEESQNEKEFMKREINEHIVLISSLQIRLDQQRIRAEYIEKQTNTSLETKIYDLHSEIQNLQEKLRSKDKIIDQQEQLLKESQKRLEDTERDIAAIKEDDLVVQMQRELEELRQENKRLKSKLSSDALVVPNIVENIISDKNTDIEKLKEKLIETEKELHSYTCLNLDKKDLRMLADLKTCGTPLEQIFSIIDLSRPIEQVRRYDSQSDEMPSMNLTLKKSSNDTVFLGSSSEPEISRIEKVGPPNMHYTVAAPLGKPNSTEILKSAEKKVHFQDTSLIEKLESEAATLRAELEDKQKMVEDLQMKVNMLNQFEEKITTLQAQLDHTEQALINETKIFQQRTESATEKEKVLGVELAESKLRLSKLENEIEALKRDSHRKDEMCLKLAREKKDLESNLFNFKRDSLSNLDAALNEKNAVIKKLQNQQHNSLEEVQRLKSELEDKKTAIKTLMELVNTTKAEKANLEKQITIGEEENNKLKKDLSNKNTILENLQKSLQESETVIKTLKESIKKQEANIVDKDCEIEILNEDLKHLQNELGEADDKIKELKGNSYTTNANNAEEQATKISDLNKEVSHLQDLVNEKQKVITRMTEDHNRVHLNLKAIEAKLKETGNVFDLANRLRAEQNKTFDLLEEVHSLKAKLLYYEATQSAAVEDITVQLKKELENSVQIDSNILNAVSDQSVSSISDSYDIETYKKSLTMQKTQNKQLMRTKEHLEKQKVTLEHRVNIMQQELDSLQGLLDKERVCLRQTQIEDANLIEQLRIKLDAVLNMKEDLEQLLSDEKSCRKALEIQIEELKKPNSSSESTKYKSLPTREMLELSALRKTLEQIQEEKHSLVVDVKSLTQTKNELENNLKYMKEMLILEAERNRNFEEKIRVLTEKEKNLNLEILQKKFELDNQKTELEENKILMDKMEQEKNLLNRQKSDLLKALKAQTSNSNFNNQPVPETLEKLIQEVKEKTEENKKKLEYIEQIENDKRLLEAQLRSETRNKVDNNVELRHLKARCDYLFAKTLKLESLRKSLIWQKRYLTNFMQSHQRNCLIEALPNQPHDRHCVRRRHSPETHFRSAVFAVISILRMKYLVRRWHNGVRLAEKINARHYDRSKLQQASENITAANFQVGQPVSSQHFAHTQLKVSNGGNPFLAPNSPLPGIELDEARAASPALSSSSLHRDASWSGLTPPSKDFRTRNRLKIGVNALKKEDTAPLKAPQLLAQFQDRLQDIQ